MTEPKVVAKVNLKGQRPGDECNTWQASLGTLGREIFWGVSASPDRPPIVTTTHQPPAAWVAARMNRAAFLENALLQMITSLIEFANANGPQTGVPAAQVVSALATIWNETEERPADVRPS